MAKGHLGMEYISLFILAVVIKSASCLQCQTCNSVDRATCELSPVFQSCGSKQACRTITYTQNYGDRDEHFFRKGCFADIRKCQYSCNGFPPMTKSCKVWCCNERDGCNDNHPPNNDNTETTKKQKRSFESRSKSQCISGNIIYMVCGLVLILMMTRQRKVWI